MTRFGYALTFGLLSLAWFALTLAEWGYFRAATCGAGALTVAVIVWKSNRQEFDPADKFTWMALLLACASLFLTLPPDESILGGWDPGVYVQSGALIARTGSLIWEMSDFTSLSPAHAKALVRDFSGQLAPYQGMWFLPDGRVSPQFFHLYPSLLAVAYRVGGIAAELWVNPLLNVGSILLVFAIVRRWMGSRWALLASVLLMLNPAQIWQARFPTAEMLTQVLLLAGLWMLARKSWLAGPAFGLALLCRYDTIMFLAPLGAASLVFASDRADRRQTWLALAGIMPFVVQAVWHQKTFAPHYHPVSDLVLRVSVVLIGAVMLALFVLDLPRIGLRRWFAAKRAIWVCLAVPMLGLAVLYAAWWRPRAAMAGPESANFYYLTDLFTPLGVGLAAAGFIAWMLETQPHWRRAWGCAAMGATVVLVFNVFNDHFLMWVARRFVPVVVPAVCIASVAAARRWPRLGLAGILAVLVWQASAMAAVSRTRDWPGLTAWCRRAAEVMPPRALVFCDQSGFAAPLRAFFDRRTFELYDRSPDRRQKLAHVMGDRIRMGDEVYFLTMSGKIPDAGLKFEETSKLPLETYTLNVSKRGVPRGRKARGGEFVLYRVWEQSTD